MVTDSWLAGQLRVELGVNGALRCQRLPSISSDHFDDDDTSSRLQTLAMPVVTSCWNRLIGSEVRASLQRRSVASPVGLQSFEMETAAGVAFLRSIVRPSNSTGAEYLFLCRGRRLQSIGVDKLFAG